MVKNFRGCFALLGLFAIVSFGKGSVSHAAPENFKGVVYSEVDNQKLQVDIYGADAIVKKPAILLLHGGGWVSGSRAECADAANLLAPQGYVCFAVTYRLVKGDKNRYPAQIDDVQRAVRWIRANADKYGVNPDKIGALGGSAGGHLAALLGTADTRDNSDTALADYSSRVQCVVDLFGPTDFVPMIDGTEPGTTEQAVLTQGFLGPLPENAKNYRDASPITHVDAKSSPFLIFHGGKDKLVPLEQSQKLDEALRKVGVESKLVIFPNAGHGYSSPILLMQTLSAASNFFERHLKK